MNVGRARFCLQVLIAIGAAAVFWGLFGPAAVGAASSDALAEQLDLELTPDGYVLLSNAFATTTYRFGWSVAALGLAVVGVAWVALHSLKVPPMAPTESGT